MDFDFKANESVDDLQLVPEQFRGAYIQDGDKFVIAPTHKVFTDLATGLNVSLRAARAEVKKGKPVDLSPLAEYGTTPAEIAEKVKAEILDRDTKLAAGLKLDPEKIKQDVARTYDGKLAEKDAALVSMNKSLNEHLIGSEATRAIAALKGAPDLLLPHIERQVKVVQENGRFVAVVVDKDGDARISGTTGHTMTIAELVTEMKASPTFGRAFESEAPAGTGVRPGAGQRVPPKPGGTPLTALQKIEAGLNARAR